MLAFWAALAAGLALAQSSPTQSVGVRGVVEGVVSAEELQPRRTPAGRPPIVVRILRAAPHGTGFRYDIEYYGLEAGRFDLGDYLELTTGARPEGLAAIPVQIDDPLPVAAAPAPEDLEVGQLPQRGGYRAALIAAGVVWVVGLLALINGALRGRRREAEAQATAQAGDPLGDLARTAGERELSTEEQGQLERLLLARWFLAAGLSELPPERALTELRGHATYGPRLQALEAWLHRPQPEPADLQSLLAEVDA